MTRQDNDEPLEEDGPSWYPEHADGMTILRLDLQRIARICNGQIVIRFHTNRMYSMTPKEYLEYFYPDQEQTRSSWFLDQVRQHGLIEVQAYPDRDEAHHFVHGHDLQHVIHSLRAHLEEERAGPAPKR